MINLIAWLQNQDNNEKDLILKNGELYTTDNQDVRFEITRNIFEIDTNGKKIFSSNQFNIIKQNSTYLIKLQTLNIDEHGRTMPMLILIQNCDLQTYSELEKIIDKTLNTANYSIEVEQKNTILKTIKNDLENIIKKKGFKILGIILLILALIFIINQIIN